MEPQFVVRSQFVRAPNEIPPRPPAADDIVAFAQRRPGFHPDPFQQLVPRSTAKRGILNCTRQWGKTTLSAAKAVHRAFTVPKSLIVVASPGLRQSAEWIRRAADLLARLNIPRHGDGSNRISLLLPNGSRIVGLPEAEAKIRGFSALSMLVIDEAARVSDETYRALRPMLSVGEGDLWMLSTPCGKQGFFYETWEYGTSAQADGSVVRETQNTTAQADRSVVRERQNTTAQDDRSVVHGTENWFKVRVTAVDCPRISAAFLEEQRSAMGIDSFRQEHMCEFIGSGFAAFDRDLLEAALDDELELI